MLYSRQKRIKVIGILVTALSLSIGRAAVNAQDFSVQAGTRAEWRINSVSDQPVAWYRIDVWTYLGSWKAESGSYLTYTVTEVNETIYGDIIIGNLTVTDSSSAEISSGLVLGILTWGPGLITHTNWTKHTEEAKEQVQSEWINGTLEIKESIQKYMEKTFETIQFAMTSASQNTTLTYDKNSGFLLEAKTGFGQYFLDIEISSVNPPLPEVQEFLFLTWKVMILPFLFVVGFGIWKWRRNDYH